MRNKILMTLALLLTAVTGAWAQDTYTVQFKANGNTKTVENITLPHTFGCTWNDELGRGTGELDVIIQELYGLDGGTCASVFPESDNASVTSGVDDGDNQYIIVNAPFNGTATVTGVYYNSSFDPFNYSLEITCAEPAADPNAIDVTPGEAANTWTFTMPAYDVEIAPIYAPTAMFATDGNLVLTPTAIEGVYAESTEAIVTPGKVANIGETENPQGTVMYAVTSTNQATAPALTAFSADVPTAKDIKVGSEVLVWYYIKGADTPDGETATAENTFNDSEICATPITVTVLSNKFDINFKAANDNTIEAGKATVTVGGTAATVTEGKLTGVKMGSEVKVTAKDGYKFRKVEAKKHEEVTYPLLSAATTEDVGKVVCAAGHLHDAKTAVPDGCTAVGILGKVTGTGHGLILALKDAKDQTWNTINGWTSASYAGTTLKVLPDDAARGTNLTSYTTLGETTVSNWAVAQKSDYAPIFVNLGSTNSNEDGTTYDGNVNAYFTGVGGTERSNSYWSTTETDASHAWYFGGGCWAVSNKSDIFSVWPVLGF